MRSFPFFRFREESSLDHNLYIQEKTVWNGAERDVSFLSVPGRSGDLILDNGRYKNVDLSYTAVLLNATRFPFATLARRLRAWLLSSPGYFPLTDSYDPDYFRLAAYKGGFSLVQELEVLGTATLSFSCKPYRYSLLGEQKVILSSPGVLYNPESEPSLPYVKVVARGDVTLFLGRHTLHLLSLADFLDLDFSIPCALHGGDPGGKMVSGSLSGVSLDPGENAVSWVGEVERLEILPRWCCL